MRLKRWTYEYDLLAYGQTEVIRDLVKADRRFWTRKGAAKALEAERWYWVSPKPWNSTHGVTFRTENRFVVKVA